MIKVKVKDEYKLSWYDYGSMTRTNDLKLYAYASHNDLRWYDYDKAYLDWPYYTCCGGIYKALCKLQGLTLLSFKQQHLSMNVPHKYARRTYITLTHSWNDTDKLLLHDTGNL